MKYALHPYDHMIEETEEFYTNMAEKGFILNKRGAFFSRFEKSEPQKLIYRVEYSVPGFLEDPGMDPDQLDLYEECGWKLAAQKGVVNVFCASPDVSVTELYSDNRQRTAAVKALRRRYFGSLLASAFLLAFYAFLGLSMSGEGYFKELGAKLTLFWYVTPAIAAGVLALMVSAVTQTLSAGFHLGRLCRRFRKNLPLRRGKSRLKLHMALRISCAAIVILLFAIGAFRLFEHPKTAPTGGEYLTLKDIVFEDDGPGYGILDGKTPSLKRIDSVFCRYYEVSDMENGHWLYETVFVADSEKHAEAIFKALAATCRHASEVAETEGFDEIIRGVFSLCIRRGNRVVQIDTESDFMPRVLEALKK